MGIAGWERVSLKTWENGIVFKILLLLTFWQTWYATKHPLPENQNTSRHISYMKWNDCESIHVTLVCINALLSGEEGRKPSSEGGAGLPGPTPVGTILNYYKEVRWETWDPARGRGNCCHHFVVKLMMYRPWDLVLPLLEDGWTTAISVHNVKSNTAKQKGTNERGIWYSMINGEC